MTTTIHYLGVRFSQETNKSLLSYISENNIHIEYPPKLGFHTTIIHSRTSFSYIVSSLPKNPIGTAGENVELYGPALVLPFKSHFLEMTNFIVKSNGAISDYPEYKPHITISTKWSTNLPIKRLEIPIVISEIFYREWETDNEC